MIDSLKMLDRNLLLKINSLHTPLMDTFMWLMSESWHTYFLVAAIAFAVYKKHAGNRAPRKVLEFLLGCAMVVACADMSTNVIKHSVKRYRPTHNIEIQSQVHVVKDYRGGKYGFFSSHSANAFGLITFIFFSITWIHTKFKLLLFLYPLAIAYSRMYLGVHYPSDVFVGMISGLFFGTLIYYITNTYFFRTNEQKV